MICPLEGHECQCDIEGVWICPPCKVPAPPKPTMEYIERLVDAYGVAHFKTHGDVGEARAALLAAIRAYGEG